MNKTIVLETSGKHESVLYATVHLFETVHDARMYIASVNTGKEKYWKLAQVLESGETVYLDQPHD